MFFKPVVWENVLYVAGAQQKLIAHMLYLRVLRTVWQIHVNRVCVFMVGLCLLIGN